MLYARLMGAGHVAIAAAVGVVLVAGIAGGQGATEPAKKYKIVPLNLQRQQQGTQGMADVARARVRDGDCEGALTAFEEALRTSNDPTIHRDRGLCHEKLGHPYPAIDDYRVYLTHAPDALDADGIRARLLRLEDQTSGRAPTATSGVSDTDVPEGVGVGANVSVGSEGASASAGNSGKTRDKTDHVDIADDPLQTPLARGKGWAAGPFFAEHKWLMNRSSLGGNAQYGSMIHGSQTWTESVGLQVRYAPGPAGALVLEVGYEHFNGTSVDAATASALTSQIAYEFKFPVAADYKSQLFLAPGLGYEHLAISPTDPTSAPQSYGAFVPRVRFGYRYLFLPSVALEGSLDAGFANFFAYHSFPFDSSASGTTLLALNVGVLWGL
jgi:hypothetical protein